VLIERLSWAGLRVTGAGGRLLVDALGDASACAPFMGEPREPLAPVGAADAALITHLHPDHFDAATLRDRIGEAAVFCPLGTEEKVAAAGLTAQGVGVWEQVDAAGFTCTAVPAVDGLGDAQVSWVVAGDGQKVIHCGDTLWHGSWWRIAARTGPFAAAFVCINGASVRLPGLEPSGIEADLTPEQAAAAASVLAAELAIPIHYGTFDNPPVYEETADAEGRFRAAADARGVEARLLSPGAELRLR
jgi:L-ascorbate metabolism protein UlaG (beta-lactamase superfamily)